MESSTNYRELAEKIYEALGGSDHIESASNCMTRLRLKLTEKDDNAKDKVKKINGVLGVNDTGEEFQIVLGPGKAAKVAAEFQEILKSAPKSESAALKKNIRDPAKIKKFFKKISGIFIPLIPGFIACGLITGFTGAAVKFFPELAGYPAIRILIILGNAVFWGMNLFVGYNAAHEFGGSPILGGALAAFICHPGLADISFDSEALTPGRGGVIAVILVAAFAAWIEKRLHKIVPEIFDLFATPLITLLTAGFFAIFVLQPAGGILSDAVGKAANYAIMSGGAAAGFILAGQWLPMVMIGIHQAMTPVHVDLIARYGATILLPALAMAGAGQVGASAAVYFMTNNKVLKKTVASALPAGIMGVGEPLIYGVTLPLFRPFIAACIGGAFGGAVTAHFAVGAATLGISGLPLAGATDNIGAYLLGIAISYIMGFVFTWALKFDDPKQP